MDPGGGTAYKGGHRCLGGAPGLCVIVSTSERGSGSEWLRDLQRDGRRCGDCGDREREEDREAHDGLVGSVQGG